jgi:cellobiose-specific phosphotransferase system component IIA
MIEFERALKVWATAAKARDALRDARDAIQSLNGVAPGTLAELNVLLQSAEDHLANAQAELAKKAGVSGGVSGS